MSTSIKKSIGQLHIGLKKYLQAAKKINLDKPASIRNDLQKTVDAINNRLHEWDELAENDQKEAELKDTYLSKSTDLISELHEAYNLLEKLDRDVAEKRSATPCRGNGGPIADQTPLTAQKKPSASNSAYAFIVLMKHFASVNNVYERLFGDAKTQPKKEELAKMVEKFWKSIEKDVKEMEFVKTDDGDFESTKNDVHQLFEAEYGPIRFVDNDKFIHVQFPFVTKDLFIKIANVVKAELPNVIISPLRIQYND